MELISNYNLSARNTFGVDVVARYFAEVSSVEELKQVLNAPEAAGLPVLFLGGGSNILFTQDFEGLVISLNLKGITENSIDEDTVLVTAQAGENWHQFVLYNLEKNYGGLENLSLIPGNVGTSPVQNIGAYGVEIKDHFESCEALNLKTHQIETFNREQCAFGYRDSFFKREGKGKYVILSVTFRLSKRHHDIKTDYGAIKKELTKKGITEPTIQEVSQAVVSIRQSKLPYPKITGNAGSFFKNPVIDKAHFQELNARYPNMPGYETASGVKVPAGWLIETAGWKGKQIGNVATHQKQALVIINATGKATGKEIYDFSEELIRSIEKQFRITLEREVNVL
ncbi:UDP-N-acetylmuramate dehydrogenase [Riemerella columbipharyngis]|uniref:UDP-N-acetylenolpyruvoylglucosamine reductase n=1 Tax=Riemerella columbipharyngis TaxID=1071918 RepID=A0A1G7EEM2_9FLAO|nr:UDP-N-acetylmuramate dehydrogenase [Riemerella columbipharyngis]SDE62101.1 UDP-N-acetylmuramate dehydrogenase [Riemerella columbipharyngis]